MLGKLAPLKSVYYFRIRIEQILRKQRNPIMKQTTTTKGKYSHSVSPLTAVSLSSQEKVQPNKPYLIFLYLKAKTMKTILTSILALFIQVTVFSQVTSFTCTQNNDKVDLKWTTSSEKNVSHFVIEKSIDGKNYSQAGIVFAYGNTSETMNYPFFDKNINGSQTGMIYYRLSAVANDGKNEISEVAAIRIGKKNEQAISMLSSTSPAGNEIRIATSVASAE
jgi:hypothetical protein